MEIPEIHVIGRIEWQIFGTLTFKKANHPEAERRKMWFAEVRSLAKWYHVYFPDLLWVLRIEQGESTGRTHYHCLIGGLPEAAVSGGKRFLREDGTWDRGNRTTHALEAKWARMGLNPADKKDRISRFSLYDARPNGVSYIAKCLGDEHGRLEKDLYESGKFNLLENQLILSDSIHSVARAYLKQLSK